MLAKYTIAGVAGSVLLASIAFAQSPTGTTDKMKADAASDTSATSSSFQGNWRASKMVGLNVYNDNNESVGSINDMLTDKSGSVQAVVIGVGGFLGVGEHLVAVPFDKVKFVSEPVAYSSAASYPPVTPGRLEQVRHRRRARRTRCPRRSPIPGIRITPCTTRPRMS